MEIGARIDDRYIVQQQLGENTYIVVNISSGVKWILKALPLLTTNETVQFLQRIRHPSLPRIFETFKIEADTYYLLEYIEGSTLLDLCKKNGGKLPCLNACEYMAKLSRTLYFLHSQNRIALLHLDIKPSNIIISKNNLPCLIDYGTLQPLKKQEQDQDDDSCQKKIINPDSLIYGTPGYTPPEIIQGRVPTEQSDIFMVGMTLMRLITGQEPDPSLQLDWKSWISMMPTIVAKTIQKCIMNNPEDRYGNASELACDLEAACNNSLCYEMFPNKEHSITATFKDSALNGEYNLENPLSENNTGKHKEKIRNVQNRVLCVWNNASFAAELSSVLAKIGKKVLIIDADLLSPGIDLLLDIKDSFNKKDRVLLGNSSLADLMEEFAKKRLSNETIRMCARKTSMETLSCLCGDYRMEDYEYYSTEGLVEIIKTASTGFDYVVVSCGKFIFDEFTCVSQICADRIFVPIIANSIQFREFNRYIHFLAGRKQLEREKILFVAYDYMGNEDLSFGTCDELCNGAFIGAVSYSTKRRMMQGTKKPYINAMESKIEKQYLGIIKKAAILAS